MGSKHRSKHLGGEVERRRTAARDRVHVRARVDQQPRDRDRKRVVVVADRAARRTAATGQRARERANGAREQAFVLLLLILPSSAFASSPSSSKWR